MNAVLEQWNVELGKDLELVQAAVINEEAMENMVAYGMPQHEANKYGKDDLETFISAQMEIYRTKTNGNPMLFYSWFDEQAGQLRMSAVSKKHNKLPFGSALQECNLAALVESVLRQEGGLFTDEGCLKIWVKSI